MKFNSLQELIQASSSTRRFFLSLPVEMQLTLHARDAYIHTAEELHRHVFSLESSRSRRND